MADAVSAVEVEESEPAADDDDVDLRTKALRPLRLLPEVEDDKDEDDDFIDCARLDEVPTSSEVVDDAVDADDDAGLDAVMAELVAEGRNCWRTSCRLMKM